MKVSVIIPVYNAAPFLNKSIQSALDQKQTGEVILIDDRSTDASLEICKEWERKDSRVKVFVNVGLKGAGTARNIGIKASTCEYLAFLDADDFYLEGRFKEDARLFSSYNNIDAVANSIIIQTFDEKDHVVFNSIYRHSSKVGYGKKFSLINITEFALEEGFYITGVTVKKTTIHKLNGFDESLKQCQDTDLLIRLVTEHKVMSGDREVPVCVYNIHENNTIKKTSETFAYRLRANRKFFLYGLRKRLPLKIILAYLKTYLEMEFLKNFGNTTNHKKLKKILLFPYLMYKFWRNEK